MAFKKSYSLSKAMAEEASEYSSNSIELDPSQVDAIYSLYLTLKFKERTGEFTGMFKPKYGKAKPRLSINDYDSSDEADCKDISYDTRFINKIFNFKKRPQEYNGQLIWSKSEIKRIIYVLEEMERDDDQDALYVALRLIYNYKMEGHAPEGEVGF